MWKWAGIAFGIGLLIIALEWRLASKKKEGVSSTDKRRMMGILWVSAVMAVLVGWIAWMAE